MVASKREGGRGKGLLPSKQVIGFEMCDSACLARWKANESSEISERAGERATILLNRSGAKKTNDASMGKRSEFYHRVALMILQEEASSIDDATQMLNKDICQEESKYWLKLSKKLI